MSIAIATAEPSTTTSTADPVLASVTSRDGTTIGYRRFGSGGPGLILLHGSASSGAHHTELARLLADAFTVIVPDRRGRGLSGPNRPGDVLEQEIEDVAALVEATGVDRLWGVSSGAALALNAARVNPAIRKLAVYDPAMLPDRATAAAILRRFDEEMARGQVGRAMVTAMRGAEMGPGWMRALPTPILTRLVAMGMRQEANKPAGDYPTMGELAPTIHNDFAIVTASSGRADDYRSIAADVLLMGGGKSPAFLKQALTDLARVLPNAKRIELAALDHAASWNRDVRGNPAPIAAELRRFFR
jgi:pimeloyl-ACP methyl ester carboxylesterase